MINQILFLLLLYTLGLLIVFRFRITDAPYFSFLSAFIWGASGWVCVIWMLGIFSIPITRFSAGVLLFIGFSSLMISCIRRKQFKLLPRERTALLVSLGVTLFFIVFFSAFNFAYASPDTFFNILAGRSFAALNWQTDPAHYVIWGPYLPFIQASSPLFNLEYIYGFNPVLFFVFLIAAFFLFRYAYQTAFEKRAAAISLSIGTLKTSLQIEGLLAILALLLIISTNYVQQFMVYIHSNWITSIYFTIFSLSIWLTMMTKKEDWLPLLTFSTVALTLCRVESVFIIAVPLFLLMQKNVLPVRTLKLYLTPVFLFNVLWGVQKLRRGSLLEGSKGSDVFLYGTILFFILMIALLYLLPLIRKWKLPWNAIILIGFSGLFLLAFVWQPTIFITTLKVMYLNLTDTTHWNLVWTILPPLLLFAFLTKQTRHEDFFQINIFSYLILVLVFAPVRGTAYRVGWFDSGNRMMLHIYPLLVFYVLYKVGLCALPMDKNNQNNSRLNSSTKS